MSTGRTYDALAKLKQRKLPYEIVEAVVAEFNSILDSEGESGHRFRIPLEELHVQIIDITSAPGDKQRTGKLIIDCPQFLRKLDAALEFFKSPKVPIGFKAEGN